MIDSNTVILSVRLANSPVGKVSYHLLGRQLVEVDGVEHLLDGQRLTNDVGTVEDRVLHVGANLLTQHLLVDVPDDGVMIHDHNRVLLVIDQGIADSLHIDTIRANLIICMHDAIDRIGIEVIGENLERVGMHEKRVTLGEVDGNSPVGGHRVARSLVVLQVVTDEHVLVDGVVHLHVAKGIAHAALAVVIDTIAHQRTALVADNGAPVQLGVVGLRVVITVLGIDMAAA